MCICLYLWNYVFYEVQQYLLYITTRISFLLVSQYLLDIG